jgi:glycosyltransferase involved in cell wall biosynthesis
MTALGGSSTVAYLLRSYPRLTQTFVLHEILGLEALGVRLQLWPVMDPHEQLRQSDLGRVRAPVRYLDVATQRGLGATVLDHLAVARRAPSRYVAAWSTVRRNRSVDTSYSASSRFDCLHQAAYLARRLRGDSTVGHLHAHFAHDPTLIALLTHRLTGISFSFTAHARDLYQIPRQALADRISAATAVITCCEANALYLDEVAPRDQRRKIHLIHHGVDVERFRPSIDESSRGDGAPLIVSVGRLVDKKGFPDLLRACAVLARTGRRFRCAIYGDGPLLSELTALVDALGISDLVTLESARPQDELIGILQSATMFALAPFVTSDGDRDGMPNVLLEAMACGLPVVSTRTAGIPELIQHDHNGLLAQPRDADDLAKQCARLIDDTETRTRLAEAGRATVTTRFDERDAAAQIATLFEEILRPAVPRVRADVG